jgi:hypothetical protein
MGWEFAPFTIQLILVHRHLQDRRPISSPSTMCRRTPCVRLMSTLLGIRRSNLARHQVATSCSTMFRSPSLATPGCSHCSADAHKLLTTQGAEIAQSLFTQDSCQHVTVVPNSRRKWLSHQPHQCLFQYAKRSVNRALSPRARRTLISWMYVKSSTQAWRALSLINVYSAT